VQDDTCETKVFAKPKKSCDGVPWVTGICGPGLFLFAAVAELHHDAKKKLNECRDTLGIYAAIAEDKEKAKFDQMLKAAGSPFCGGGVPDLAPGCPAFGDQQCNIILLVRTTETLDLGENSLHHLRWTKLSMTF
jgi:hypothetical protein